MNKAEIPRKTVYRLSLYQRSLERLRENKVATVSSAALAKASGVKPPQLRKDLAYFGQFGTRGLGYDVESLSARLTGVLGTTRLQPVILVGVGNLGSALLHYQGFAREGYVDAVPGSRKGSKVDVFKMERLPQLIRRLGVKMAILTVPPTVAQDIANRLVGAGVQGILNFSPIILQVPDGVVVNNVDLAIELENLSYFIR